MPDLYTILPVPRPVSDAWPWDSVLGSHFRIVGYTALGDVLLSHVTTGEFGILLTYSGKVHGSGYHDLAGFTSDFLGHPRVIQEILRPELVAAVQALVGPRGPEEVYIPVPYPLIGGSGEPHTYSKGQVWVFLSLVAQTLGMDNELPSTGA